MDLGPCFPLYRSGRERDRTETEEYNMKPLEGIKVVDLTTYLAAPTTVRVLGEWGADCVKIESA